jgi:hypothetical protein
VRARTDVDEKIICSACGSDANRGTAKFCLVCGKLMSEGYEPLDVIRSAHGMQRKGLNIPETVAAEPIELFRTSKNSVSETAWACVVYSMVPYLGILFVPLGFLAGIYGYYVSYRRPHLGGRSLAAACIGLSLFILAVQIFLWWLFYVIPEIGIAI